MRDPFEADEIGLGNARGYRILRGMKSLTGIRKELLANI
jgi:hypothetical protein